MRTLSVWIISPAVVVGRRIPALYLGWRTGPVSGAICGTVCGLLQDLTMFSPYLGLNGASKTVAGFVAGYLSRWVPLESPMGRGLAILCFSLVDLALIGAFLVVLGAGSFPSDWKQTQFDDRPDCSLLPHRTRGH